MRLNFSYVPLALVTSFDWSCHDKYVFKLNIRLQRYKIFFKNALFRALNMRKVGEDVFSIQVLRLAWRGYINRSCIPWNFIKHLRQHCRRCKSLICVVVLDVFLVEFLLVDGPPGIDDVGQYEGNEERDVEHGAQGELTRTAVGQRQR